MIRRGHRQRNLGNLYRGGSVLSDRDFEATPAALRAENDVYFALVVARPALLFCVVSVITDDVAKRSRPPAVKMYSIICVDFGALRDLLLPVGTQLITLAIYLVLFGMLERRFPIAPLHQKIIREGFWTDVLYFASNVAVGNILRSLLALSVVFLFWSDETEFLQWLERSRLAWPMWSQVLLTLLIMDFVFYWQHWLFHHSHTCWRIHEIHHSSTTLDWLSTSRLHVFEMLFFYILVPQLLILVGFAPLAFIYGNFFKRIYNFMLHANVRWTFGWLGHILASPVFHRWHHESSCGAKNLATMFSFYDHLFGTWHLPEDKIPVRLGVAGANVPNNILLQQVYPFLYRRR